MKSKILIVIASWLAVFIIFVTFQNKSYAEIHYDGSDAVELSAIPGTPVGAVFVSTASFDKLKIQVRNPDETEQSFSVTLYPHQVNYRESVLGSHAAQMTFSIQGNSQQWIEMPLAEPLPAGKYAWQLSVDDGSVAVSGTADGDQNGSGEAYSGDRPPVYHLSPVYSPNGALVAEPVSGAGSIAQKITAGTSFNALSIRGFSSAPNGSVIVSIYPWGGTYDASVADYNTDPAKSSMWDVEDRLIARAEITGLPGSGDTEINVPLPTLPAGEYLIVGTASARNEAPEVGWLRYDGSAANGGGAYTDSLQIVGDYAIAYGTTGDLAFETQSEALVSNGYFSISGDGMSLAAVSVDPDGNGKYAHGIIGLDIHDRFKGQSPVYTVVDPATLQIGGVAIYGAEWQTGGIYDSAFAANLQEGALGQTFTAPIRFSNISFHLWTPVPNGSEFTVRLKKGVHGAVVAEKRITNHTSADGIWYDLDFAPQDEGEAYYAELVNHSSTTYVYWLGFSTNVYNDGVMISDGVELAGQDADLKIRDLDQGALTVSLVGDELSAEFHSDRADAGMYTARLEINTPWQKKGYFTYDTNTHYFSKVYTSFSDYYSVEQLKRRGEQIIDRISGSIVTAVGKNGYNLELQAGQNGHPWGIVLDEDRLRIHMQGNGLNVMAKPQDETMPAFYPKFTTSDPSFDADFNRLYLERGFGAFVSNPQAPWFNWLTAIHSWADTGYRELLKATMQSWKVGGPSDPYPDYVYSWSATQPGWPMPVDGDGDGIDEYADYDKRHFDTNAGYIVAAHQYYMATRDYDWLAVAEDANGETMMDKLRRAMDFQLRPAEQGGLGGQQGYVTLPGPYHDGTGGLYSLPSSNWDAMPFGHLDLLTNVGFYRSLQSMAELEMVMGRKQDSKSYAKLAKTVATHFAACKKDKHCSGENWTFWNSDAGRFIGNIDANGVRRDFGFVELNLQALYAGLGSQAQANAILDQWLDGPDHEDIYYFKISPRTNTIDRTGVWEAMAGTYPAWKADWPGGPDWIGNMQNLGTIFYSSYYDMMSRLHYKGADNAWNRMSAIMERYREPDRLSGGDPFLEGWRDTFEAGIAVVFPESGMVPISFLKGFMGVQFDLEGMTLLPNLPTGLDYAKVEHLSYWGRLFTVSITRTAGKYKVEIESETNPGNMNFRVNGGSKTDLGNGLFRITRTVNEGKAVTLINKSMPGK